MKKLIFGFILAPSLALGFSDVPEDHPYKEAIEYAKVQKIVEGYPDGTYKPGSLINRAEFLKIALEINALEKIKECNIHPNRPLADVPLDSWYSNYVCEGIITGLVTGYNDGTFRPSQSINFVEASKILSKLFEIENNFPETGIWYENDVKALEQQSAIPTSVKTFDHKITRGEMAEIIYRLKLDITEQPSSTYEDLK